MIFCQQLFISGSELTRNIVSSLVIENKRALLYTVVEDWNQAFREGLDPNLHGIDERARLHLPVLRITSTDKLDLHDESDRM